MLAKYINVENIPEWSIENYGVVKLDYYDIIDASELYEDVAPVIRAHWICKSVDDNDNGEYTCSHCGFYEVHSISCEVPYCWKCGAKMDEEVNDGQ